MSAVKYCELYRQICIGMEKNSASEKLVRQGAYPRLYALRPITGNVSFTQDHSLLNIPSRLKLPLSTPQTLTKFLLPTHQN